jgi:hypothetical protein
VGVVLLAAAGLAIGVGGYSWLHRPAPVRVSDLAAFPVPPVASTPAVASPSAVSADTAPAPTPAAEPAPTAPATPTAPAATAADFQNAPPAPLDPTPAPSNSATEAAVPGAQRVTITTVPPKGKFFHFGKEVGTSPFVVDLPPGEKRAYEVWLPGHITRKVLVDGSKPELTLGLREEAPH